MTLTDGQSKALAACLGEAICGLGIADDCDEIVADRLDDKALTMEETFEWADGWDTAIKFHNELCSPSSKFAEPWVRQEVDKQISKQTA